MTKEKKIILSFSILIICYSLFLLNFFKIEPDYFWHIKAGEYMHKHGILQHDVFSWYTSGKYWMSHEWLFEIIIYFLKLLFGSYHVLVYSFTSIVFLLFSLYLPNKKDYLKNIPFTFIYLLFFFLLGLVYIQARPHLLSFSLLALTFYFLYDLSKNEDSKKIYFLPLISIIWANIHGGSSNLPYLLCLIFIIGGLFSFNYPKIEAKRLNLKQIKKYLFIMLICMISVCINVHGFKMFLYPYENMANTVMLQNISEWRNTSLNEGFHYVYYAFLLFIFFTMLFSKKKINFLDLLLFGFGTYLGLKSIRFWLYTYIFMNYIIFSYVKSKKIDSGTISCILISSLLLISSFIINANNIFSISYQNNLNKEIISTIKKEQPKKLFNMYDYGGELIYHNIPVFIDGRADLYSKYNYQDYLNISTLTGDYVKLIKKYDFDYLLVSKNYPIYTFLKYDSNYKVIYQNKKIVLFQNI